MGNRHSDKPLPAGARPTHALRKASKASRHSEQRISSKKATHDLAGNGDAQDIHAMLKTAINAVSNDPQTLSQSMQRELEQTTAKAGPRLDLRLVICAVLLLFIILLTDLLIQRL